ncbi:hypothetical protein PHAVU_008G179800, partial [Phaseolus vulgaris]
EDEFTDSDEDIPLVNTENGKLEKKAEEVKAVGSKKPDAKATAPAKKVKVVEPEKDNEDSDDDSNEDEAFGISDEEMDDVDSDDSDEESDRNAGTPHSAKKGGKTPNSEGESPKSGGLSCKSCSKSFNSDSGRQQYNKAKHDGQ